MGKCMFIDLSRCTGCRGCQVACKQWKKLPAEKTKNWGSYQNPPDLGFNTLKLVRFSETEINKKLHWLFFPEACRHCYTAPCKRYADEHDNSAVYIHPDSGAVVFTERVGGVPAKGLRESCPYDVPRSNDKGVSSKCDFCYDRVSEGILPSCVLSCPTGAMNFGDEKAMRELAAQRLAIIRKDYPKAYLGDPDNTRVIYLYQTDHRIYYQDSVS